MDSTFRDMIVEGWLIIYMDDVLVFAETLEECQEQTRQVLDRMQEEDLHLKLAKCTFNQTEVEYLGLVVLWYEVVDSSFPLYIYCPCLWVLLLHSPFLLSSLLTLFAT